MIEEADSNVSFVVSKLIFFIPPYSPFEGGTFPPFEGGSRRVTNLIDPENNTVTIRKIVLQFYY
jgi:hypothetical protein